MLDFSDHRIICLTICIGISVASIIAIVIRYLVHRHRGRDAQ